MTKKSKKENILGIDVYSGNYLNLKEEVLEDIKQKKKSFIVAINPEKIMTTKKDEELKELLNKATYQIPDGMGVILASKIKKGEIKERITGIDSMMHLCEMAEKENKSVFLYGAKPNVAETASKKLIEKYPKLNIKGVIDGYEKDKQKIIDTINKVNPDILFVALGSPKQEKWIMENMDLVNVYIFQGVGGSFDVISGNVKRAPDFFQKNGLEWLYRLIKQPTRAKRQLKLIQFLMEVIFQKK